MMESQVITERDVVDMVDLFTKVPAFMLKRAVSQDLNVVEMFESQVQSYKSRLSDEDIIKIKKVLEMPIPELQEILKKAYDETHKKQLKILADPEAEPFIAKNFEELKNSVFNE
jgi:ABC-type lipoprotein release transport system permease subunit